ncbi:fibronectin type III domain-containing protein, partial [Robiginitalea biformata]
DADGVTDDRDNCSGTPAGESVDANGCSDSQKDSDNDGVSNDMDQCPGTPTGETVNSEGCSESQIDDDGDGVPNSQDQCPDTAPASTVDANGCSASQSDNDPPSITNIEVTNITETSFTVDWRLNEGSKGYIRFGTASGVYVGSSNIENNYLTRHIQTVGGNNPFPLNPNTTYYWQIYVEDQYGNTDFSPE